METHFSSDALVTIVVLHKHMKLFKPFKPRVIAWSVRKGFNQSTRGTKEQTTRLQWLASAMPKPVMPSGHQELWKAQSFQDKTQGSGSVSKNAATESFFLAKLSSSNVKVVALTRAPGNEGENQGISLERSFTLSLAGQYWHVIFPVFLFVISGFGLLFGWMLFLAESLCSLWNFFY